MDHITSQVSGRVHNKSATESFHMLFWHFVVVFHHEISVFVIFISFFNEVSNFRKKILTKQKRELVVPKFEWNNMKDSDTFEQTLPKIPPHWLKAVPCVPSWNACLFSVCYSLLSTKLSIFLKIMLCKTTDLLKVWSFFHKWEVNMALK